MNRRSARTIKRRMAIVGFLMLQGMVGQVTQVTEKLDWEALANLSFQELADWEHQAYVADEVETLRKLCEMHGRKAKKQENPIEQARGYIYRTVIEEAQLGLRYADSIIQITQYSDHPQYPTKGYFLKAGIHYEEGAYRMALENYGKAYELALKKGNLVDQRSISMNIAAIRNINGQPGIADNLYHRALKLLKGEPNFEKEGYQDHMLLLYNLSLAHLRMNQLDSAQYYATRGAEKALTHEDKESYRDFVLVGAQVDFFAGTYQKAKDTLLKYVDFLEEEPKAMKWYYLGKIAEEQDHPEEAIAYFKAIDSLISLNGEPFPELKQVYLRLITHAADERDRDGQLTYIEKLIRYDSILTQEKQGVVDQAVIAYDIPYLKAQRKLVQEALDKRKKWLYGFIAFSMISMVLVLYFFMRNRRIKRKIQKLMDTPDLSWKQSQEVVDQPKGLPPVTPSPTKAIGSI